MIPTITPLSFFSRQALVDALLADARRSTDHDFGRSIIPELVPSGRVYAYDFQTNQIPGEPAGLEAYWRDVGSIDAFYEANIDLRAVTPALNLYNKQWPLRTASYPDPPAKFAFDDDDRRGQAIDSVVSGGCILSGGLVRNSVLSRWVRVHSGGSRTVSPRSCTARRSAPETSSCSAIKVRDTTT